jgi:hypothetical protein
MAVWAWIERDCWSEPAAAHEGFRGRQAIDRELLEHHAGGLPD